MSILKQKRNIKLNVKDIGQNECPTQKKKKKSEECPQAWMMETK